MRAGTGKWVLLAAAAGVLVVAPTLPLLVFATILFGALLRSLAEPLAARTRLPEGAALSIVVVLMLALPVAGGALLAPSVKRDLAAVSEALPRLAERGRAARSGAAPSSGPPSPPPARRARPSRRAR
jgi:predicted PurR-regulated permease PerM